MITLIQLIREFDIVFPFNDGPIFWSRNVNPRNYSDVVCANMLHNAYAALVTVHTYSPNAMTDPNGTGGNVVFMHLFIDSLSILRLDSANGHYRPHLDLTLVLFGSSFVIGFRISWLWLPNILSEVCFNF